MPTAATTTAGIATAAMGADETITDAVAVAVVVAVVAMITEDPLGARVGAVTRAKEVTGRAATTAATGQAEEAMEVVDTVVGTEAPARGAGPGEAQPLLEWRTPLERLRCYFDRVDSGARCKKLHTFGVPNGTLFCDFFR